ncbi:MAG TPA: head-tail connector protein [Steroidobacteraceae bacterium]|nr:head-tail connector protein [Steroidobacteraceae bacterium]
MSSLQLVTPPTVEPVSLSELKAHARIEDAASDVVLGVYLQAAREHVEAATGRALLTQAWKKTWDSSWPGHYWERRSQRMYLPKPPLQSITSVQYIDPTGAELTLDPSQYQLVQEPYVSYLAPAYGVTGWPATRCQPDAVTVTWVAGWTDAALVPAKLRTAIMMLAAHWFATREAAAGILTEVPFGVQALISSEQATGLI